MDLFCKDCKHSREAVNGDPYRMTCASPHNEVETQDYAKRLVSGIEQPVVIAMRGASCTALRTLRDVETDRLVCGPAGKWFEVKES